MVVLCSKMLLTIGLSMIMTLTETASFLIPSQSIPPSAVTKTIPKYSPFPTLLNKKKTISVSSSHIKSFHLHSSFDKNEFEEDISNNNNPPQRPIKQYFATCIPGLENILANELQSLGATNIQTSGKSGVYFTSSPDETQDLGLKIVLWVRTAHRVMELICSTDPTIADYGMANEHSNYSDEEPPSYHHHHHEPIQTKQDLYSYIRSSLPLQKILGDGHGNLLTLSIDKIIMNGYIPKELCHSHYTSLTVKNAIVDEVRDLREDGIRPDVDVVDADVPFVVVLKGYRKEYGDEEDGVVDVSLYRCIHAGGSLHRRGYRRSSRKGGGDEDVIIHKAALKESLASALLYEAGWDKLVAAARYGDYEPAVFVDPMSGSATFPIEAALMGCDVAPGLMRIRCSPKRAGANVPNHEIPPLVRWKDGPSISEWKALLQDAATRAKAGIAWAKSTNEKDGECNNLNVYANERYYNAYDLAKANIGMAGLEGIIKISHGDCADWDLGGGDTDGVDEDAASSHHRAVIPGRTIIGTNPPWGKRLNDLDIEESWTSLKAFLQRECNGAEAWILSGNKSLTRILRMKKSQSLVVRTAGEDLRWIQYHIFAKRPRREDGDGENEVGRIGRTESENAAVERRIRNERENVVERKIRNERRFDYDDYAENDYRSDNGRRRIRDGSRRDGQYERQQPKKRKKADGIQIKKRRTTRQPKVEEDSGGGPWY